MTRCPRCRLRMVGPDDIAGREVCMACGQVVSEPEPDVLTKLLSNATPETEPSLAGRRGRPIVPLPDLMAIRDRVLARVRTEAGR